jgi:hypothetical protein
MGKSINLNLKTMKKTIFIADRWVKFTFNEVICVGRTYLHSDTDLKDPLFHLVHFISEERETRVVNFHECVNLRYLGFVKQPNSIIENPNKSDILSFEKQLDSNICPGISGESKLTFSNYFSNQLN